MTTFRFDTLPIIEPALVLTQRTAVGKPADEPTIWVVGHFEWNNNFALPAAEFDLPENQWWKKYNWPKDSFVALAVIEVFSPSLCWGNSSEVRSDIRHEVVAAAREAGIYG